MTSKTLQAAKTVELGKENYQGIKMQTLSPIAWIHRHTTVETPRNGVSMDETEIKISHDHCQHYWIWHFQP